MVVLPVVPVGRRTRNMWAAVPEREPLAAAFVHQQKPDLVLDGRWLADWRSSSARTAS